MTLTHRVQRLKLFTSRSHSSESVDSQLQVCRLAVGFIIFCWIIFVGFPLPAGGLVGTALSVLNLSTPLGDIDEEYPNRGYFQALGVLGFRHFVPNIGVTFSNQTLFWKGAIAA